MYTGIIRGLTACSFLIYAGQVKGTSLTEGLEIRVSLSCLSKPGTAVKVESDIVDSLNIKHKLSCTFKHVESNYAYYPFMDLEGNYSDYPGRQIKGNSNSVTLYGSWLLTITSPDANVFTQKAGHVCPPFNSVMLKFDTIGLLASFSGRPAMPIISIDWGNGARESKINLSLGQIGDQRSTRCMGDRNFILMNKAY